MSRLSVATAFVLGLVLTLSTGCSRRIVIGLVPADPAPYTPMSDIPTEVFRAGAAERDITPMPGYPMGGHAIAGQTARGVWLPLYARAIYLEDAGRRCLVMVSCDLWSMPAGLADRVAEIVRAHPDGARIERERIIVAATHTHQSPAGFSSSKAINEFAAHRAGFDRELFEFLAQRIAEAILDAVGHARRAVIYVGEKEAQKLFWNRSLGPFMLNPEAKDGLADLPRGVAPVDERPVEAYRAVDPIVRTWRIVDAENHGHTLAIAAFLAAHPEAMPNTTQVYSSDLFGVAALEVGRRMARLNGNLDRLPVVAIFNGAEGDISTDWWPQGRLATARLGAALATTIVDAATTAETALASPIEARYRILTLPGREFIDPDDHLTIRRTAEGAMLGVAALGGTEDGYSFFHDLGWIEGVKGRRTDAHGSKHPALDPRLDKFADLDLSSTFLPVKHAPREAIVALYRIGDRALVTLPGEFTFTMGRRIKQDVAGILGIHVDCVSIIGLANEYLSYVATPEEYEAQHYEGASTLYGPASGPLYRREIIELARACGDVRIPTAQRARLYDPGFDTGAGLRDIGAEPYFDDDGLEAVLEQCEPGVPNRDLPRFVWLDTAPEFPSKAHPHLLLNPAVRIEQRKGDRWVDLRIDGFGETDAGSSIVTVNLEVDGRSSKWMALWMPPDTLDPRCRSVRCATDQIEIPQFRFSITRLRGDRIKSPPFHLSRRQLYPHTMKWEEPPKFACPPGTSP